MTSHICWRIAQSYRTEQVGGGGIYGMGKEEGSGLYFKVLGDYLQTIPRLV